MALATGRPVVYAGPDDSDVAHWISELGVGYVVQPERIHEALDALHELAACPPALSALQHRAKKAYDANFCKALGVAAWDQLLRRVVDDRRPRDSGTAAPLLAGPRVGGRAHRD